MLTLECMVRTGDYRKSSDAGLAREGESVGGDRDVAAEARGRKAANDGGDRDEKKTRSSPSPSRRPLSPSMENRFVLYVSGLNPKTRESDLIPEFEKYGKASFFLRCSVCLVGCDLLMVW